MLEPSLKVEICDMKKPQATEMGEMRPRLGAGCDAETLSLAPLLYAGVHIPIAICDWQQALS